MEDLFTQLWSVKDSGKVIISKEFEQDHLMSEIEYFNDRNNEWWISEAIGETDKTWIVYGFKDE